MPPVDPFEGVGGWPGRVRYSSPGWLMGFLLRDTRARPRACSAIVLIQ